MEQYDVAVVGAGPAGGQCARSLTKAGVKVILVEKQKEIGEPNFSTAGTPEETLKIFDLPDKLAPYKCDKVYIGSSSSEIVKQSEHNNSRVFDFRRLNQYLAEDAAKYGAEIAIGTTAGDLIIEDNKIKGIKYQGIMSSGEIRAKIIVDASGSSQLYSGPLGIIDKDKKIIASALEFEMTNVELPYKNCLYIFIGNKYIPNGYGWVFPMSDNIAKIGVARVENDQTNNNALNIELKSFLGNIPWLRGAEPVEFHGSAVAFDRTAKNFVRENFVAIGTSASHINPFAGEGVRHGMMAGKLASEVIKRSLDIGDTSENQLAEFNKLWLEYSKNNWEQCYRLAESIYKNTDDTRIDECVKLLDAVSGDELFDILYHYNFNKYAPRLAGGFFAEGIFV